MFRLRAVAWLALFLGSLDRCRSEKFEEENGVLVLNEENFDAALREFPVLFVDFYAPWCGHCKKLAPIFEEVSQQLKKTGSGIRLAKIDVTVYKSVAERNEVKYLPTLKLFMSDRSEPIAYTSRDRSATAINRWLVKRNGSPAELVKDLKTAQRLIKENDLVALGFFKNLSGAGAQNFLKVALENDNYMFGLVVNSQIFNEYRVAVDTVIVFKQFDEGKVTLKEVRDDDKLKKFLDTHQFPMVNELSQKVQMLIWSDEEPYERFLFLFSDKSSANHQYNVDVLRPVVSELRGQVLGVVVDAAAEESSWLLGNYGVNLIECPAVLLYDRKQKKKYKYSAQPDDVSGRFNWHNLVQFGSDSIQGVHEVYLKSQPLPSDWNANPVKVIVQKNFKEVVLGGKKNVFIEFYAPWCGMCKKLEPIWNELGSIVDGHPDTIIAKIDATANEIDGHDIDSFPTIKYFPKNGDPVVVYTGDHTLMELTRFLQNGGKIVPLPVPDPVETKTEEKTEL